MGEEEGPGVADHDSVVLPKVHVDHTIMWSVFQCGSYQNLVAINAVAVQDEAIRDLKA